MTTNRLQLSSLDGIIVLSGEVDAETAPQVAERLGECAPDSQVRLDVSAVTFMDSSALRVLVAQHHRLEAAGGRLEIVQPSRPVTRLFEITSLNDVFHVSGAD